MPISSRRVPPLLIATPSIIALLWCCEGRLCQRVRTSVSASLECACACACLRGLMLSFCVCSFVCSPLPRLLCELFCGVVDANQKGSGEGNPRRGGGGRETPSFAPRHPYPCCALPPPPLPHHPSLPLFWKRCGRAFSPPRRQNASTSMLSLFFFVGVLLSFRFIVGVLACSLSCACSIPMDSLLCCA